MRKTITLVALMAMTLAQSQAAVYALDMPEAPEAPEAPGDAPEAPEAPEPPPNPFDPTPEPQPSPEPETEEESTGPDQEATTQDETQSSEETQPPAEEEPLKTESSTKSGEDDGSSESSGADNNVGDTEVETGDATATGSISTEANNNANILDDGDPGGVSIINDGNGADSTNTGSASISNDDLTVQNNSAVIDNYMEMETSTGENSASRNVGDSSIETGDANTSGTIVTAVNTNVDGVAVAEFNVVDDHIGDIILDFGAGCITGCGALGDTYIANTGNGSDSDNNADLDYDNNQATFQNNDATIGNDMILAANSGDNNADNNTNGDSTIDTGDANVSGNVLTFANNNIDGGVVYSVVNLFGDLVGDIIFPEEAFGTYIANTDNGSDSTNNANYDSTNETLIAQENNANINNNLIIDATTGDNSTSANTGGSNEIETGDTTVEAQVMNVANTNIVGDAWLVLVNEAGKWIGKIMGAAPGANYAGSEGMEFVVDEYGEITVTNAGNGSGSTNNAEASVNNSSTTVQTNNADINNNVVLSANTGGNSASRNTGGDNSISTGDATVMANIMNFVNNNVAGDGRLFVTVVNVFDSWIGNFISPGYEKEAVEEMAAAGDPSGDSGGSNSAVGGPQSQQQSESGSEEPENSSELMAMTDETEDMPPYTGLYRGSSTGGSNVRVAGITMLREKLEDSAESVVASDVVSDSRRTVNINLAWLIIIIPMITAFYLLKRRFATA